MLGFAAKAVSCPFIAAGNVVLSGLSWVYVVEIYTAAGVLEVTAKHIFLHVQRLSIFCVSKGLLDGLPIPSRDDGIVDIPDCAKSGAPCWCPIATLPG